MHCEDIIEEISRTLKNKFNCKAIEGGCILTTPFLDPSHDPIILTIKESEIGFEISDQTRTMEYLFLQGMDIKPNTKQKWIFDSTIEQYGAELRNDELTLLSNKESLVENILDFIEMIKSIDYLIYTSQSRDQSTFFDDVAIWLKTNGVRFIPQQEFVLDTGDILKVDFEIKRLQKDPIYSYALHSESMQYAESLANKTIVNWVQLKDSNKLFYSLCIIDDEVDDETNIWKKPLPKLKRYTDKVIFWGEREEILPILA